MAVIAEDVIATAGADTDINGRTLTSGGTWQPRLNASANINIVDSTPDYFTGSSTSQTATYKNSNISSSYDDEVISPAMRITTLAQSSQGVNLGITGTQAGADKKWYSFYIDPGTGDFRINKLIEASAIDFAHSVSQASAGFTVSTGVDYEMKIRRINNGDGTHTLKGYMDGAEVISWTDDGVTNGALLDMGAGGLRTRAGGRHYGFLHQTWAQTLTPSLFSNTNSFYAPTASPGAVSLAPSLFSNGSSFYSATITNGVTIAPSLFVNSQSFYAPTVTPGAVALTPSLVGNSTVFYAPVVSQGGGLQSLAAPLYANVSTFYSFTISAGNEIQPVASASGQIDAVATIAATIQAVSSPPSAQINPVS